MMKDDYLIGLDFGTDSVRALLVSADGKELASSVCLYPRWSKGKYCDPKRSQFRQHPMDYLESMESVLKSVISKCDPSRIRGIGVDTTASTPCAVNENGIPLSLLPEFAEDPNAMFLLWKDHSAIPEAERINSAAQNWPTNYTAFSGGTYSCEWFWSKILHVLESSPSVRNHAFRFVEHCDWITSLLSGSQLRPGRCTAGHKAMWHKSWGGFPPSAFFKSVSPLLPPIRNRLPDETFTADIPVGSLSQEWAKRLGLSPNVIISGGVIDCHAGAIGAGIQPKQMVKIMGTSTCDIIVAPQQIPCISGICGQVDGSVLPGFSGLEAGQAAFGDIYAWFQRLLSYGGQSINLATLEQDAANLDASSVFAIDWHNGRRTPNANPQLQGALFGLTLGTDAPSIYRALAESTVFGSKAIFEHLKSQQVEIKEVKALGGIAKKSPFIMQMCADVLNVPISVVKSEQACALGSAILAAAAAKCHPDITSAIQAMHSDVDKTYLPQTNYDQRFSAYQRRAKSVEAIWKAEKP